MKFSQRIRRARRNAKLSQQALGKLLGVQRSAVSNWESASDIQPAITNLIAIAMVTNVSLEWLATGRGSMQLGHDPQMDIPAVDGDLAETPHERELLKLFRKASNRAQNILMALAEELVSPERMKRSNNRSKEHPT